MPVWQSVTAVRKKRVYLSPHLPFGWFDYPPGANRLLGLLWLSEILYPDLFRHDYPREIARVPPALLPPGAHGGAGREAPRRSRASAPR